MPAYHFQALDAEGKTHKGVLEGDSEKQIRQKLREQKLFPIEVSQVVDGPTGKKRFFSRNKRITLADVSLFTRQLATLLLAAIPLEEAIWGVAEQTDKKNMKSIIMAVRSKVLEGLPLAQAMSHYPSVFNDLYRATIYAGEQTGQLDKILNRLADYIENQQVMRQKIQQALIYPSLMVVVSIIIVCFLLMYVVPQIISVFQNTKQALPMVTQVLLWISHFVANKGIFVVVFFILMFALFFRLMKNQNYRRQFHFYLLQLPFMGYLIKTVNTARFARTLGLLNSAGIPVVESLRVASQLILSIPIREKIQYSSEQINQGSGIAKSLKETGYFSAITVHLIANGEASGKLELMLEKAAQVQEDEMTRLIDTGLTLLEPVIIIIMGGIVLFIVLAVLLPIFQMDQLTG
jgi:general secretion pathway protein F